MLITFNTPSFSCCRSWPDRFSNKRRTLHCFGMVGFGRLNAERTTWTKIFILTETTNAIFRYHFHFPDTYRILAMTYTRFIVRPSPTQARHSALSGTAVYRSEWTGGSGGGRFWNGIKSALLPTSRLSDISRCMANEQSHSVHTVAHS